MKRAFAASMALILSGCATYDLMLMPRGPGDLAHGTAKQIDKSVSIDLGGGEIFIGKYAFVQGGSFALGNGFSGGSNALVTGYAMNVTGNGNILAHAQNGHNLRCVFNASGWTHSGTGECLTDDGKVYDLQISR